MLAYKKLLVIDTPWNKLVLSPTRGTPWKLENGFYTLRCDDVPDWKPREKYPLSMTIGGKNTILGVAMPRIMPSGIYTCKNPDDRELIGYAGNLFEMSIGGTVVEHERGYRSSVAVAIRCVEEYHVFPEQIAQALYGMSAQDFREIGQNNACWLFREAQQDSRSGWFPTIGAMDQIEQCINIAFRYPVQFPYREKIQWT